MAAKLIASVGQTGLGTAAVFVRLRQSDGAVWNGSAFEAYNASNIATYAIAATEIGATGDYQATDPAEDTLGEFRFIQKAGADLAVSDWLNNVLYDGQAGEAASGSDPLEQAVPGDYAEGTLGYALGNYINMPFSSLGALLASIDDGTFADGTNLTIRRGEDRYNADGRPIVIVVRNIPDGVTITSAVLNLVRGELTVRSTTTNITITDNVATCLFDLAGSEASQLPAGDQGAEWTAQLTLSNGHKWEPIGGLLIVLESRAPT